MARIRSIKPEFFRHLRLYQAEKETKLPLRVAFAGLWTACDREGRFRWEPDVLKLDSLPFDQVDFSRVLDALTTRGFLVHYGNFGCIPSWIKHQVVNNKERSSEIPAPPKSEIEKAQEKQEDSDALTTRDERVPEKPLMEGKGKEGKGKEQQPCVDDLETKVETCYQAYPTKRPDGSSTGKSHTDKVKIRKILAEGSYDLAAGIEFHKKTALNGAVKNLKTFLGNLPDLEAKAPPVKAPVPRFRRHHWIDGNICALCGMKQSAEAEKMICDPTDSESRPVEAA